MAKTSTALTINPKVSHEDFIRGRTFRHQNGEIVRFSDHRWCIQTSPRVTVNFGALPNWLIRPAKLTIAQGWLILGLGTSWCTGCASIFRRIGDWLAFPGRSISKITDEHKILLERRLENELSRYNDTLQEASSRVGRTLSDREKKRIANQSNLHGPRTIRTIITAFNTAAHLSEEIDGLHVPIRLRPPRKLRHVETSRPIGSADPQKVLSPEQLAELEWALGRDLQRYEKAKSIFQTRLARLDLGNRGRPTAKFETERYFGLNGFREHHATEIALLRGLSPNSSPEITRRIRRFLTPKLGVELTTKLLKTRSKFIRLRSNNKLEELNSLRKFIHDVLAKVDLTDIDLKSICIERYFGLNSSEIQSLATIGSELDLPRHIVSTNIQSRLRDVVGGVTAKRLLKLRSRLHHYLSRAIKAQALRLQLAAARRVSAILELPVEPKMKTLSAAGRHILEVQFVSRKTWGDEGLLENVPCIDQFADIANDAILTAQRLTKPLRMIASKGSEKFLFIIPDRSPDAAVKLSTKVLQEYVYTNQPGKAGLLRRYALDGLFNFEIHHARHTHSTHMIEAGGTLHDVARYLGHITFSGSTNIAGTFYLAGGTEEMRRQTADALRRGAATGIVFDGVARLKIEAMGGEALDEPVPPNQLSFEEAKQRILSADILEDVPVDAEEAAKLLHQKVVFNVTREGGCLLPATTGPCPTANPCAIGIQPRGAEPLPGCGCKYLVLLPNSADQLSRDIDIMEAQLAEMKDESWAAWRSHTLTKLNHYKSLRIKAQSLNGEGKEIQGAVTNRESARARTVGQS